VNVEPDGVAVTRGFSIAGSGGAFTVTLAYAQSTTMGVYAYTATATAEGGAVGSFNH